MSTKKVGSQVNKAVHLILKEHWDKDIAIEAVFTSVADKIDYTSFYSMVLDKLEGKEY